LAGLSLAIPHDGQVAAQKSSAGEQTNRAADEAAIQASAEAFIKAYNGHDAEAIAALFAPDAKVLTEEGETIEGREAIAQQFADIFADEPQTQTEVSIGSVRFIGADLAIEAGTTKTTPAPGETPEYSRYTVLHIKRDGKWLMAAVRDTEGEPPTNYERLRPLEWMIGEWIDESEDSVVLTACRWSDNKNYILQEIKLRVAGSDTMEVTQRIGWDPLSKRIKSWVFDSEGGYGEGVWARDGDTWIVKSTAVRRDGITASATNVIALMGKDAYLWQSTDRVVGNEVMPPIEVKVVRKPPELTTQVGK
jgi:uncharacterized protein (TIGR02246 family)